MGMFIFFTSIEIEKHDYIQPTWRLAVLGGFSTYLRLAGRRGKNGKGVRAPGIPCADVSDFLLSDVAEIEH